MRPLSSPLEVFTAIHHSNNNHLNTLLFYLLGDREHEIVYRLPSLVAGTASVALAAAIAARRGRLEAVLAALLTGSCFTLLHFSSEARGYAPAVAFCLGAQLALAPALAGSRAARAAFGACVALAILSHLIALFYYAGALALSGRRLLFRRDPAPRSFAALHALPCAVLLALWWVDLRLLAVGGGNPTDYAALAARTVGFSLGLPVAPALAPLYAALAAAVLAAGVWRLRREGDDDWIVYAVAVALAPALVIGAFRPYVVAVRYFVIGIALWLIVASFLLADLYRAGGAARAACIALVALFLFGNARHTAAFFEHGRGGYLAALRYVAAHTPGPRLEVGSDHDFRNGMVLRFYARQLPPGKHLVYLPRSRWPRRGPEWLIVHRPQHPEPPLPREAAFQGHDYVLAAEFDHAAISGFYWALYRRADASEAPPGGAQARRSSTIPKP